MFSKLEVLLEARKKQDTYRELVAKEGLIDFCSNDYLGIANSLDRNQVSVKVPSGSTGSRLIRGNYSRIEELEHKLSIFHESDNALVFTSGYTANLGVLSALPRKGDTILYDALSHASLKDGMRLSHAQHFSFKHNDLSDLVRKIEKAKGEVYVVVEAVYSMDGDQAPLKDLVALSKRFHFCLIVDEAHSVGVFGERGEGLVQELGLQEEVPIRIITFGKAVGCHGAAVLSSELVKNFLINYSRPFIYTTANSPRNVEEVFSAYHLMEQKTRTKQLRDLIDCFVQLRERHGGSWIESTSAVQTYVIGESKKSKALSEALMVKGLDVRPILSPTVLEGTERLRFCIHAFNTKKELNFLFKNLL